VGRGGLPGLLDPGDHMLHALQKKRELALVLLTRGSALLSKGSAKLRTNKQVPRGIQRGSPKRGKGSEKKGVLLRDSESARSVQKARPSLMRVLAGIRGQSFTESGFR